MLCQLPEFRIILGYYSNLDLGRLKIYGQDGGQASDRQLYSLVEIVILLLLQLLFEVRVRLRLFRAHRNGSVTTEVPGWVSLVDTRTLLLVVGDEHHGASERSHLRILCVHLTDISDALAQSVHGYVIAVLVLEVSGFIASALNLGPTVGCRKITYSRDDSTNVKR